MPEQPPPRPDSVGGDAGSRLASPPTLTAYTVTGEHAAIVPGVRSLTAQPPLGEATPAAATTTEHAASAGVAGPRGAVLHAASADDAAAHDERFRLVTEAIAGFVYDWDVHGARVTRSAGLLDVVGVAPAEAPESPAWWRERLHPDDIAALDGPMARAIADPSCDVCHAEYRVRHADGHWVWVLDRSRFVRDADGRVVRVVGATSDVSARRAVEDALRDSETSLRLAQQAARCGVWDGDPSRGTVRWSPEYYGLYGLDPDAVAPSYDAWLASIHPDDRARVHADTQRAIQGDGEQRTEFRVRRADTGAERWIASIGRVVRRDPDGTPRRMVGIALDVTERRRAELALQEQAEAMRALANRLAALQRITAALAGAMSPEEVAAIVIGRAREALGARAGGITAYDDATDRLRMLGTSGFPDFVVDDWSEYPVHAGSPMAEAVRTGRIVRVTSRAAMRARYPAREADVFAPLDAHALLAAPMRAHGRVLGALLFLWAEPGRPDAEQSSFAQAVADQCAQALERARLYEAERLARAEAEAASRAKSEFLATMSHELRTPLNAIQGYAQLLDMEVHGSLTAAQHEAVQRIERSQQHLLGLINAVLNLARIEAGRVDYELAPVAADALCTGVDALVRPLFDRRGIAFACAGAAGAHGATALTVHADEEKARQVLLNLLSNASKFTAPGGTVALGVAPTGDGRVAFAVRDSGIGIPADKCEAIFEPFVQVDGSRTRRTEGAGLGLAISRDLARGMGGDLMVESTPGEGSTFTLVLPAV